MHALPPSRRATRRYHHSIVLAMTWSWLHWRINFGCLGMLFNCLVHVFMYYYYYVTSFPGVRIWWKKWVEE